MSKPVFPFRGTQEQRDEFLAEFRDLWQIHPAVDLVITNTWARWYIPMRINGRRIYWKPWIDTFEWGLITPRLNGWNPYISHPSELREWLAIPDSELKAVHRANVGRRRPWRAVGKIAAFVGIFFAAMWLISLTSRNVAGLGVIVVVLGMSKVALGMFGQRLQRISSFADYRERLEAGADRRR